MSTRRTTLIVILIAVALMATVCIVAEPNRPTVAGSASTPAEGNNVADQAILGTPPVSPTAPDRSSGLALNASGAASTATVPPENNDTPNESAPAQSSAGPDVPMGQAFLILNVSNVAQPGSYTFTVNVYHLNSVVMSFNGTMKAGLYYLDETGIQFPMTQSGTYQLRAESNCTPTDQVGHAVRENVTFNVSDGNFYMVEIGVTGVGTVIQSPTIGFVPIWNNIPIEFTIDQGANWRGQMYQVFERCPVDNIMGPEGLLVAKANFTGPTALVHLTLANLMDFQMPGMTLTVVTCPYKGIAEPQTMTGSYKQMYVQANHPGTYSATIDMTSDTYPMSTMHLPDPTVNSLAHATVAINIKWGNPDFWGNYTASYMINGSGTWNPINYGSLLLGHVNLTLDLSWAPTTPDGTLNITIGFVFTMQGGDELSPVYDYLTLSDGGNYTANFIQ